MLNIFIRTNSGVSGPGGAEVGALSGVAFDDINEQSEVTFRTDAMTAECGATNMAWSFFDSAFGNEWFANNNTLIYILRRVDGERIKLQMLDPVFGDTTNTYSFHWGPLANSATCDKDAAVHYAVGPIDAVSTGAVASNTTATPKTADIDASAGGMSESVNHPYVYFDLDAGAKVDVTDFEAFDDHTWDIAIKRVVHRLNGGDSGPSNVSVAIVNATSLDAVTTIPADDQFAMDMFVSEECEPLLDPIYMPLTAIGTWYDYDMATSALTPLPLVYVIKTSEGAVVKMRITAYGSGQYSIEWVPMS